MRGEIMHFEILVEDQSGKKALDILVPKILGDIHTFRIHGYKGVGRIPENMTDPADASKRILLENLPKLLQGYGKSLTTPPAAVVLVCDLDDKCGKTFRGELLAILDKCEPKPETRFCFAIEEGEAWLLGDLNAIKRAYPKAKDAVLHSYVNDSVCGTWEKLADAVTPGGCRGLSKRAGKRSGPRNPSGRKRLRHVWMLKTTTRPVFSIFAGRCGNWQELPDSPVVAGRGVSSLAGGLRHANQTESEERLYMRKDSGHSRGATISYSFFRRGLCHGRNPFP